MTDVIGPSLLAVGQGVSSFNAFLPSFQDVRKASVNNREVAGDVRMGEVAAVTVTIGIGAIASSLTGSSAPAYTAVAMSLILVILYEYTLRSDRPMEEKE